MSADRWARRRARRALVQAVYQWQMADADTAEIESQVAERGSLAKADAEFFKDVLRGVLLRTPEIDELLTSALERPLEELDNVERAVLRLGVYELSSRPDVPYRAVIDEYVELAKTFGAEDGHKFVNAVLDRLARSLRAAEVAGRERI